MLEALNQFGPVSRVGYLTRGNEMKWEVLRCSLITNEVIGRFIIHAADMQSACAAEGHHMNDTEEAIYSATQGQCGTLHAGFSFVQEFNTGLHANRRQAVQIFPCFPQSSGIETEADNE